MTSSTSRPEAPLLVASSAAAVPPRRGDLGARVDGGRLLVPASVYHWLQRKQIATAEALVVSLHTFPSAFRAELGWSGAEVAAALKTLVQLLRPHVAEAILAPPKPARRGYGARR